MSEELHDKIILELADINFSGSMSYYINNEPLLDSRLPRFIRQARKALPSLKGVRVQTNGKKLASEIGAELLESGVTLLVVNNYSGGNERWQRMNTICAELRERYPGKTIVLNQRRLDELLSNRGGRAPNKAALTKPLAAWCQHPFRQLNVTVDGSVVLCCLDVLAEQVMGNVMEQSMRQIWNSDRYRQIRGSLGRGDRSYSAMCEECDYRGFTQLPVHNRRLMRHLLNFVGRLYEYSGLDEERRQTVSW